VRSADLGNGDVCPLNPAHGRMYVVSNLVQYCPHSEHVPVGKPVERTIWPLGRDSFAAAVDAQKGPQPA
jgi:hypothetical protein